ncbi:hypothetical protein EIP86_008021 [Pleurotus ostreatoroseus]|nr:hypothetical protein EIP86_008021 [Pleurotus ostreatoroseus]
MDPSSTGPAVACTPPRAADEAKAPRRKVGRMYAFQVRAFIEATEVVDADPDVIEDLLDGFEEDEDVFVDDGDEEHEHGAPDAVAGQAKSEERELLDGEHVSEDEEDAEFALYIEEAEKAWTKEEVKAIMKDLKEHGTMCFVRDYVIIRKIPIVKLLYAFGSREKLLRYNTVDDAVDLIKNAKRIIILTGAGIRKTPLYFKDKGKLLRNYTQNIDTLEVRAGVHKVLQCHGSFATASCINCHQHVPGIAIEADILNQRVPLCKICNATPPAILSAEKAKKKPKPKKRSSAPWESDGEEEPDVPAYPPGIMKPDITFFGEKLTDDFDKALLQDRPSVDLLLVIGTSLKVSPVAEIITHFPHSVPQILINKTPVKHINPDIVLLGNADEIVQYLCDRLNWELPEPNLPLTSNLDVARPNLRKRPSHSVQEPERVADSHVWLFEGAEGGKWVEEIERKCNEPQIGPSEATETMSNGDANRESTPISKKQRTK